METDLFKKVKDSTENLKSKITDLKDDVWNEEQSSIIQEFKDGGTSKVKSVLENINNSGLLFLKSGYELQTVSVNLGIPPVIVASFHYNNKITDEERTQLLEDIKDQKIIQLIIKCLLKAEDFYDLVSLGNYGLGGVNITLGLTPGITINFIKKPNE
ncbi:MAG: hypothetical protein Q8903_07260 [Bacteroidota bacterium]|nr:hypothetical protein [Bacteroidota bacterium]